MSDRLNIVQECYLHDTGCCPPGKARADRDYMDWCESKVNKWNAACAEFGYTAFTNEIRTLTGAITYHEWLKKEVGL